MSKPLSNMKTHIVKARPELMKAQQELITDRMNIHKIEEVKKCIEEVIKSHEFEE